MKREKLRYFFSAIAILAAFILWTAAICCMDVQAIGPQQSTVGFATINQYMHDLTGVYMGLYTITDWLALVPLGFAMGFGILGLVQWIKRRQLRKVDPSILILGGFYVVVMGAYLLFEEVVINYRPVLIDGILEASYPSSTTMLVLCVMPTAMLQLRGRIKNIFLKRCVISVITAFIAFMVIARLISGVHWFTDIIGGILLSTGLVLMYHWLCICSKQT